MFTSKEGNTTTGTVEDGRLRVISGRGGRVSSVLDKT